MTKASGFSWKQEKLNAIDIKIQRAITMAKSGTNTDFRIQHPDWVRDAQKDDFTKLKIDVKARIEKYQDDTIRRRLKIAGQD